MKFFIKGFVSKCDQIHSFRWIWSCLLKKSLAENFNFCTVLAFMLTCVWVSLNYLLLSIDVCMSNTFLLNLYSGKWWLFPGGLVQRENKIEKWWSYKRGKDLVVGILRQMFFVCWGLSKPYPFKTGPKLNAHKKFRKRLEVTHHKKLSFLDYIYLRCP